VGVIGEDPNLSQSTMRRGEKTPSNERKCPNKNEVKGRFGMHNGGFTLKKIREKKEVVYERELGKEGRRISVCLARFGPERGGTKMEGKRRGYLLKNSNVKID